MRRDYGSFITPKRQRGPNLSSWALRGRDVFFWCALLAATCLLSCWRGTQTDELNRKPGIASRLRRRVASLPLRHQVLAQGKADLRRGDRQLGAASSSRVGSWVWQRRKRAFDSPAERACKVFCEGELLKAVQTAGIFQDSKEFVDMSMRMDPEVVLEKFYALRPEERKDPKILAAFVSEHFSTPGSELVAIQPQDFTDSPSVLQSLTPGSSYYAWAQTLNQAFASLTRKVSDDVFLNPQRYSILRRTHPVVIPGGRFRESYYWDSYWIVLGLLACDMKDTARGLVQNLLDDVANFGFVPNGGRIYYLNRSQPPLLSEMVLALLEADAGLMEDADFVASATTLLDAEYTFWMEEGNHAVALEDKEGHAHVLNRYWTSTSYPRPESFKEDLASKSEANGTWEMHGGLFANIAAGAESGWDFSSRWIPPGPNGTFSMSAIETSNVLPVELNAYLYRMERNLARLHELQSSATLPKFPFRATNLRPSERKAADILTSPTAIKYSLSADKRAVAMDKFMWDGESGMWRDYVIFSHAGRPSPGGGATSVSNFIPLWAGLTANPLVTDGSIKVAQAIATLKASALVQVGGLQTTVKSTREQWDRPNAWPPLQQLMIEGLVRTNISEGIQLAEELAKAWLESNYLGFANSGYMHEKYNAFIPGARGEGGEYYPQVGFGWTNGVVLHLLKFYGDSWAVLGDNAMLSEADEEPSSRPAASAFDVSDVGSVEVEHTSITTREEGDRAVRERRERVMEIEGGGI